MLALIVKAKPLNETILAGAVLNGHAGSKPLFPALRNLYAAVLGQH